MGRKIFLEIIKDIVCWTMFKKGGIKGVVLNDSA